MTEHPITPSPELRRLWAQQAQRLDPHDPVAWIENVATKASRWGADHELEACCQVLYGECTDRTAVGLRAKRRPKPVSQADAALQALEGLALPEEAWTAVTAALGRLKELEALPE